jgi:predicted nucleotidyltransferase
MTREETLTRLRALEPELRERGVRSLFLFGSRARGDAGPASDVDLFFDDDPTDPMSYFSVIGLERFIQERLKAGVDLIPRDSLHILLRDDIVADALQVY